MPIDTTHVKVTASVNNSPEFSWLDETQEMTIRVANVEMTVPKGVVLKNISLCFNNGVGLYTVDEKPFSGETLEFKVHMRGKQGRLSVDVKSKSNSGERVFN